MGCRAAMELTRKRSSPPARFPFPHDLGGPYQPGGTSWGSYELEGPHGPGAGSPYGRRAPPYGGNRRASELSGALGSSRSCQSSMGSSLPVCTS